jgi:glycosyltransferase involved in cell wall biosynthesis
MVADGLDPVGSGRQIEIAAAGLHAAGWRVHHGALTGGGSVPTRLAAAGHDVRRLGRRPHADAAAWARLFTAVVSLRPATVLAWGIEPAVLARAACRAAAVIGRGPRLVAVATRRPRRRREIAALCGADRVIAVSPAVATACEQVGVPAARVVVVEPAADPAAAAGLSRADVAARLGLDPTKQWTLCVAPLVARARLDRLLWAIDQLGVVHRGLQHVLVGHGPLLAHLRRRARVQHLAERLRILPHCDCLPDLLREVGVVWQSGDVAYGGAIVDALAAGKPVVAVESDAAWQLIVGGETGWIVPPLPESEFPRRALSLIEDAALATRFVEAGRARAAAVFSRDRFVAQLLEAVA